MPSWLDHLTTDSREFERCSALGPSLPGIAVGQKDTQRATRPKDANASMLGLQLGAKPLVSEHNDTAHDRITAYDGTAIQGCGGNNVDELSMSSVQPLHAYVDAPETARQNFEFKSFACKPRAYCEI